MKLIDILKEQLAEQERSLQARRVNGCSIENLRAYTAGVSNSFGDLLNKLYVEDLLTNTEWDELNNILDEMS